MTDAKICDRCAEFYIHPGTIEQIQTYDKSDMKLGWIKYDLCPKCSKQFQKWINNNGTVIGNGTIISDNPS